MQSKDIYLMRHGDTGLKERYVGSSDVPLSPLGFEQTRELCATLSTITFDTVLCSPMLRCVQSIESLSTDEDIQFCAFLKEIDFGEWEKKTFAEIVEENKNLVDDWVAQNANFTFPGGESMFSFYDRVSECANYLRNAVGNRLLVVCHGGVIRHLLCELLHISKENYLLFDIAPGCYSTLRLFKEGGVLKGLNLKG